MRIWRWIVDKWTRVPILGQLHLARCADYSEALKELLVSLVISTAPIWAGSLVLFAKNFGSTQSSYFACVITIISNGELFIYAASTVAPVIYIVTKERQGVHGFPGKYSFIIFAAVSSILATAIFTMQRLSISTIPQPMIISSLWLFMLSVLAVYLALVFNNTLLPNPAAIMREGEQDYLAKLRRHRP